MRRLSFKLGKQDGRVLLEWKTDWNVIVLGSFLLIPFSELRSIDYQFLGPRAVSIAVLLFLVIVATDFARTLANVGFSQLVRKVRSVMYLFLVYAAFVLHKMLLWSSFSEVNSISLYTLLGVSAIMILSFFVISRYSENDILNFIYRYSFIITFLFLFIYLSARLFDYHVIYQGVDTVELHFPYIFRPYQAATLGAVSLILGTGAAVILGKSRALYFMAPVMILTIAHTGCRSVMWLFAGAWVLMLVYYAISVRNMRSLKTGFRDIVASTVLSGVLLLLLVDDQTRRAVSLLTIAPLDLLTAAADAPRYQMWMGAFESFFYGTLLDPKITGSLHNVYFDILINGGFVALALFVAFIGLMMFSVMRMVIYSRGSLNQPLYAALGISLLLVAGEFYANPMLHLPFVYVFFGLVLAILSKKDFIRHERQSS